MVLEGIINLDFNPMVQVDDFLIWACGIHIDSEYEGG